MKNLFLILTICVLPGLSSASGKDRDLFPKIDGWKLNISKKTYTPDNLWDLINGGAEMYLKYGFVDLHLADYHQKKEGCTVHVELYRHDSETSAHGIYKAESSPEYQSVELGNGAYIMDGILNFTTGKYYVKLYSTDQGDKIQEALRAVAAEIARSLEGY